MNVLLMVVIGAVLEIAVWIGAAHLVGGFYVLLWTIIAFFLGLHLLRTSASGIVPQMQQMQMSGQLDNADPDVSKKLSMAIAGFLLMLPGIISDVFAALILIPAVQRLFQRIFMGMMMKRQQVMMNKMMGGMMGGNSDAGANPFADLMRQMQDMQGNQTADSQYRDSIIIDGEAREVQPETKKIEYKDKN